MPVVEVGERIKVYIIVYVSGEEKCDGRKSAATKELGLCLFIVVA